MPLSVNQGEPPKSGRVFLIFYASIDDTGRMWCPDCRDVEETVKKTFEETSGKGLIIYIGQRAEWKDPGNKCRTLYNVQSIPTIVRLNNGKEEARLVEAEVLAPGKLEQFIQEA